ncbi:MAG: tetratricopeptide repeat protein [Pseudomonadota bacterium]
MRQTVILTLCVGSALMISACGPVDSQAEVERRLKSVNVIDETNLNDVMLQAADPKDAVNYFRRTAAENPDRIDLKRGLGLSLIRANSPNEAAAVMAQVIASDEATHQDRVTYADALIRAGQWDRAEQELDKIPPTHETFRRYRLEAMVADSNKEWTKADSFYETALGLTTKPSGVLNNWGYSKLTRGQFVDAERLFSDAITYEPTLFTAKNNLVLARGAQRKYELPVVPMDQTERAQLLHTMALTAIKQGDVTIGKGLLRDAVDTHPQHFDAAARSLDALEANVAN